MARRRETDAVVDRPAARPERAGAAASSGQSVGPIAGGGAAGVSQDPRGEPTLDQIAQRAYEIYQSRGGTDGQDMEDWLQAERELRRGLSGE
jgi:hypothetical protein